MIFGDINYLHNKAINNLTKWESLSKYDKIKLFDILLAHACQKYNLPRLTLQLKDYYEPVEAQFNGRRKIFINSDNFFKSSNLITNLVSIYHEVGHLVLCFKYEKEYLRFKKENKHLNKLDFQLLLFKEAEKNNSLQLSYLVHNLPEMNKGYKLSELNLENKYYELTLELLDANYLLNELEQAADRFGYENATFILRELNGAKANDISLYLLKQCYDKYYAYEKQTGEYLQKKRLAESELRAYFNKEIDLVLQNDKLNFKKTLSVINFCAFPALQEFALKNLNVSGLISKVLMSGDYQAITQLTRLPFIETEDIRTFFGTTKNAGGLLLLETCVSSNLNKTLEYLKDCKLKENHFNYLQDISNKIKNKSTATKLYSFASNFYDLKHLNSLSVAHLADKEVVQSVMKNKLLAESQTILTRL